MTDELKQWEYDRGYEKGKADVLDKIRAEVKAMSTDYCGGYIGLDKQDVLQIIDKYREVIE